MLGYECYPRASPQSFSVAGKIAAAPAAGGSISLALVLWHFQAHVACDGFGGGEGSCCSSYSKTSASLLQVRKTIVLDQSLSF